MAILDLLILAVAVAFYKELVAVCFDEEFAWVVGVRTQLFFLMLLVMVAFSIVMLIRTVGIVLVLALITIPLAQWGVVALSGIRRFFDVGRLLRVRAGETFDNEFARHKALDLIGAFQDFTARDPFGSV